MLFSALSSLTFKKASQWFLVQPKSPIENQGLWLLCLTLSSAFHLAVVSVELVITRKIAMSAFGVFPDNSVTPELAFLGFPGGRRRISPVCGLRMLSSPNTLSRILRLAPPLKSPSPVTRSSPHSFPFGFCAVMLGLQWHNQLVHCLQFMKFCVASMSVFSHRLYLVTFGQQRNKLAAHWCS